MYKGTGRNFNTGVSQLLTDSVLPMYDNCTPINYSTLTGTMGEPMISPATARPRGRVCWVGRFVNRVVGLFLVISLVGGAAGVSVATALGKPQGQPVRFSTVARGTQSGVRAPLQVVIRSASEWAELWRRHTAFAVPPPPVPQIDFGHEMVIGVLTGERRSGGYDVKILEVLRQADRLSVLYRETTPPTGALTTQALTYPHHLIRTERSKLNVVFEAQ